ncbi:hypothetical protein YC2023_082375 [Brassica napus]
MILILLPIGVSTTPIKSKSYVTVEDLKRILIDAASAAEGNHLVAEEGGHHLAVVVVGVGLCNGCVDLMSSSPMTPSGFIPNDFKPQVEVDDEFKSMLQDIDIPSNLLDVEKELLKICL